MVGADSIGQPAEGDGISCKKEENLDVSISVKEVVTRFSVDMVTSTHLSSGVQDNLSESVPLNHKPGSNRLQERSKTPQHECSNSQIFSA